MKRIASLIFITLLSCRLPIPSTHDTKLVIDGITITATGHWYADHMPVIPDAGPPFFVVIEVVVDNSSLGDLNDLQATRITLYYESTKDEFATFDLATMDETGATIPKGETDTLVYISRDEFYSNIEEGRMLYGCIRLTWRSGDGILATPPAPVGYLW